MEADLKDNSTRRGLGRGLAALIPGAVASTTPGSNSQGLRTLPIERVRPNKTQPRKTFAPESLAELAESIKLRGVLQPIVVRKSGDDYEIVAGERRWRAASLAGLHEVPAVVKELADSDALQVAIIENVQREDLDPLEEAAAYDRLTRDYALTQEQVAHAVGKNRATVANSLRLLKLPETVLQYLGAGKLTAGHARAIMTLERDTDQIRLADDVITRALPVRETERKARAMKHSAKAAQKTVGPTPAELQVEERLQRALGTKVRLHHRKGKGRIEVFFHSLDQLDDLLNKMAP